MAASKSVTVSWREN